jgi:ankyrin repeat protein
VLRHLALLGCNLNAPDGEGSTPADAAAHAGHAAALTALAAAGVSLAPRPGEPLSPLHIAAMSGRIEALRAVLAAGVSADARAADGRTALHWAALFGHPDAAEALLGAGANVNAADNGGATPLVCGAWKAHAAVVSVLAAAGAALETRAVHRAWGALHHAAAAGYSGTECVHVLLAAGARADAVGEDNMSVLRAAVCALAPGTLRALLAALPAGVAAADVDARGESLLHAWARAALAQCIASLGRNVHAAAETAAVLVAAGVRPSATRDMVLVASPVDGAAAAGGVAAGVTLTIPVAPPVSVTGGGGHPVLSYVERAEWRTPLEYLCSALDAGAPPLPPSVASAVQELIDTVRRSAP